MDPAVLQEAGPATSVDGAVGLVQLGTRSGASSVWPPSRMSALYETWAAHQLLQENVMEAGRLALTGTDAPLPVIRCGFPLASSMMTMSAPPKWHGPAADDKVSTMRILPVVLSELACTVGAEAAPGAQAASGVDDVGDGCAIDGDGDGFVDGATATVASAGLGLAVDGLD